MERGRGGAVQGFSRSPLRVIEWLLQGGAAIRTAASAAKRERMQMRRPLPLPLRNPDTDAEISPAEASDTALYETR